VAANLLTNAAKYTAPGGEIVVVVGHADDHAIITVRDNGVGIAPESMPQVFEMFFQANPSLDRRAGGLGIGLSVAKRMVELHGGSIEGYSEGLGRGSEFRVQLPIMREDRIHRAVRRCNPRRRKALQEVSRNPDWMIRQLVESWLSMTMLTRRSQKRSS
jgi:K+-sensing histidine kinase KdpD